MKKMVELYTRQKRKRRYRIFHFNFVFFFRILKMNSETSNRINRKCKFLPFSNSLLIICGVNQRPVWKLTFVNLIIVLSLPLCCITNSDIDSSRSTRVTIGIGQRQVRPFNDLVLLVFGRSTVTGGPSIYLVVLISSEFNVNVSPGIIFISYNVLWLYQIVWR